MDRRADPRGAGRCGDRGRAEPYEGLAAGSRGCDRVERVPAAAGVARIAGTRTHRRSTPRVRLLSRPVVSIVAITVIFAASVGAAGAKGGDRVRVASIPITVSKPPIVKKFIPFGSRRK